MIIPHRRLSPDALRGVIEAFIIREGTDYGLHEVPLATIADRIGDRHSTVARLYRGYTVLKQAVLTVKGVPMLYVPIMYYPTKSEGRATGFLLPTYGASTLRGQSISNVASNSEGCWRSSSMR